MVIFGASRLVNLVVQGHLAGGVGTIELDTDRHPPRRWGEAQLGGQGQAVKVARDQACAGIRCRVRRRPQRDRHESCHESNTQSGRSARQTTLLHAHRSPARKGSSTRLAPARADTGHRGNHATAAMSTGSHQNGQQESRQSPPAVLAPHQARQGHDRREHHHGNTFSVKQPRWPLRRERVVCTRSSPPRRQEPRRWRERSGRESSRGR